MFDPKISVIVAVKDSKSTIAKCVDSLLALDYPDFEVIVVDDGSRDETSLILGGYDGKIKVIANKESFGPSEARNIAARGSEAEFVAFTDGDCIVKEDWLKELAAGLIGQPDAVSCGGTQRAPQDASSFEKDVFFFMKKAGLFYDYVREIKEDKLIKVDHNPSCNVMYRRDVFLKMGGFLRGLWPGEDVELDHRLRREGKVLLLNPKAEVYHYKPSNLRSFSSMMFRYGYAQGMLVNKYGIFRKAHYLPFLLLFMLFFLAVVLFYKPIAAIAALVFFDVFVFIAFCKLDVNLYIILLAAVLRWNTGFFQGLLSRRGLR